jgi:glycerol-3-phosphate O-acyltransferase 3/4
MSLYNLLCGVVQVTDRHLVQERMRKHVQAEGSVPLLIFPEGTCVNNEYCVMFKRGAFDLGATVCPVAIKYNKIFVDAFWNSKRQSFTSHLVGA